MLVQVKQHKDSQVELMQREIVVKFRVQNREKFHQDQNLLMLIVHQDPDQEVNPLVRAHIN
jgi:hypothetical protein